MTPLAQSLLLSFTPKERRTFLVYLSARKELMRDDVYQFGKILTEESNITPDRAYDKLLDLKLRRQTTSVNQLNSWLYVELKTFLLQQLAAEDELPLVAEFKRRGLANHQQRLIKQLRKVADRSAIDHQRDYAIDWSEERYVRRDDSRTRDHNFQNLSTGLDNNYLVEKLRWACSMRTHENVHKVDYDYGLLLPLVDHLAYKDLQEIPLVAAYYHAYCFLTDPTEVVHYAIFQNILDQQGDRFSSDDLRELYYLGINYYIRRINQGDPEAGKTVLKLYKRGLERAIFLEDNFLSPQTYRNASSLAISLKDFDWVENFIVDYSNQLPKDRREDLRHYTLAKLAHACGNSSQALDELRYLKPKDGLFHLSSEVFRAKLYYEREEFDLLDAHLDKMSVYLKRNRNSYHAVNYQAFVRFCRRLLRLNNFEKEATQQLRQEIENAPVLTEKKWLLQRLKK